MKTAKLELNSSDATELYRGLAALERELRADTEASPAVIAMCLASVARLKDKLAGVYAKTRPIEKKQKGATA